MRPKCPGQPRRPHVIGDMAGHIFVADSQRPIPNPSRNPVRCMIAGDQPRAGSALSSYFIGIFHVHRPFDLRFPACGCKELEALQ